MTIWHSSAFSRTTPYFFALAAFLALAASATILPAKNACAASSSSETTFTQQKVCDQSFMTSLQEKALIEAQREIMVNNILIEKPASILGLSCFDQHLKQMSQNGLIFSNDDKSTLDRSINTTIGDAFSNFGKDNFTEPDITKGITYKSAGSYSSCNRIAQQWAAIHCAAMDTNKNMMTLSALQGTLSTKDPRSTNTTSCSANAALKTNFDEGLRASYDLNATGKARGDDKYFNAARPNYCAYDPKEGGVLANGNVCKKDNQTVTCDKQPAIPTGQIVTYTTASGNIKAGTQYWSYSCINPGCYFDVNANASKIAYTSGGTPPSGIMCSQKPY